MEQEYIQESYNYTLDDSFFLEDLENRHLYINGKINSSVIENVVYYIIRYNMEDTNKPVENRKPIILYINSIGGEVVSGFSVIDAIQTSKTPVYTVNLGECSSMAFLIYIAGNKRYAMPHSQFLLHDGETGGIDSTAKLKDRIEFEAGELADEIRNYVLSCTKIDKRTYDKKYRFEWYFLPNEAHELGVVDYIIGKNCSLDEIIQTEVR